MKKYVCQVTSLLLISTFMLVDPVAMTECEEAPAIALAFCRTNGYYHYQPGYQGENLAFIKKSLSGQYLLSLYFT